MVNKIDIGNECSIVFQYKEIDDNNNERRCLFTGDVTSSAWEIIDYNVPILYDKFSVIKLPHHGTENYYHDFGNKAADDCRFLVPNGSIKRTGWHSSDLYKIDTVPVIAAYDNTTVNGWKRTGFDTIININDSEMV